jgi:hypothetical protein
MHRLAIVMFALAAVGVDAVAISDTIPPTLNRNLQASVIRIELHVFDSRKRPVGPPTHGHGVYIDSQGTALTALHVAVPLQSDLTTAVEYELWISEWERENDRWAQKYTIKSDVLMNHLSTAVALSECQVNEYFSPIPCLPEPPERASDHAILAVPVTQATRFVDVVGPSDAISPTILSSAPWLPFSISDFHNDGYLTQADLSAGSDAQPFLFQTQGIREFAKGISGSPILIHVPYGEPSVFLLGIAVENLKPPHYQVRAVLLQEFLSDAIQHLWERDEYSPVGDCTFDSMPYSFSLLGNYIAFKQRPLDKKEITNLLGCMQKHMPWMQTYVEVRFLIRKGKKLNRIIQDLQHEIALLFDTDNAEQITNYEVSRKGERRGRKLAAIVDKAYSQGIDPVSLFEGGASIGEARNLLSDKEIAAWKELAETFKRAREEDLPAEHRDLLLDLGVGEVIEANEREDSATARAVQFYRDEIEKRKGTQL